MPRIGSLKAALPTRRLVYIGRHRLDVLARRAPFSGIGLIKLLHTADWQIGKLFGQFEPDDAAALAQARFDTVAQLAALASAQQVDLILVAGDVFDAQGVSDKTIHRLFNAMSGFAGVWVMLPGNHDAALSESVWSRAQRLNAIPTQVQLCLQPEPLLLETLDVAILPAPLTQRLTYSDLTAWFDSAATPAGFMRIGLAHGSVQGILAEGIDSTNPIAAGRAEQARLDYLALGDWHGTRQIDARTWYSGTPETDRFRANDSGQALLVELAGPGALPTVNVLPCGHYHWFNIALDLQVQSDGERALAQIEAFEPLEVVQLTLTGQTDLAQQRALEAALAKARGRTRSLVVDRSMLHLAPTDADLDALKADGYLGDVIATLRAEQQGAQAQLSRSALTLLATLLDHPAPVAATPKSGADR